jgi:ABC-type nickel/cobalt efflux system permease component RcnA
MGLAWLCAAICVYVATLPQEQQLFLHSHDDSTYSSAVTAVRVTQALFACAVCVFAFAFALSVGSVTWVFASEVFPYRARAKAASACTAVYFLSCMFYTSLYRYNIADVGIWGLYNARPIVTSSLMMGSGDGWHTTHNSNRHYDSNHDSRSGNSDMDSTGYDDTHHAHDYSHHSHKHHHRHKHHDPTQDIPDITNNGTIITPDYTATEFLLKLALVSLALGLIVYILIPETKGERCVPVLFLCMSYY